MKVIWTPKAVAGWQEVADYILNTFGLKKTQKAVIQLSGYRFFLLYPAPLMPDSGHR